MIIYADTYLFVMVRTGFVNNGYIKICMKTLSFLRHKQRVTYSSFLITDPSF